MTSIKNKQLINLNMGNETLVTVLTATYGYEIAVIRGRLESEGIFCFVKDELTVQVNPIYSNAIGGVKLQVRTSDLNRTIEILKETGSITEADLQQPNEYDYNTEEQCKKEDDRKSVICPNCGSDQVVKSKKAGWLFLITSLLFMCPTPFLQKRYYCFNCKQEFKYKRK